MRAVVQEFLDLLPVALVCLADTSGCLAVSLPCCFSCLCQLAFSLSILLAQSQHGISLAPTRSLICLTQSLFIPFLFLFPLCPHHFSTLWVSFLSTSCWSVFGNVLPVPPDSFSQLPAQSDASGGARVGVQGCLGWGSLGEGGDAKADDLYRSPVLLCLCCWDVAVKLLRAHGNSTLQHQESPRALFPLPAGMWAQQ